MAGKTFVIVDRASLDSALAEGDSRDRLVVAEWAFDAVPQLAIDGARWRLNGWAALPGTPAAVTATASAGNYAGYALTWAAMAGIFADTMGAPRPPTPSDSGGWIPEAGRVPDCEIGDVLSDYPASSDKPDLRAIVLADWRSRGYAALGQITRAERVRRVSFDVLVIEARTRDGRGWFANLRLDRDDSDDPALLRGAVTSCVATLAARIHL